ncbi:anti-sigma factor antagonist [Pseudonocardia sp. RS11V-5]|uniref:anti-sigma factor antagonist n=1 Tax=Pseudonocardia terrae TaxID=2905831 RepID=UPI001E44A07F|nr:anti-sigma factor antagonist [Pseudonocardia terrae]MCE3555390.1 anti-sigma factor antagonist [Pseudonocardia terrae]
MSTFEWREVDLRVDGARVDGVRVRTAEPARGTVVLAVAGEIDVAQADAVRRAAEPCLGRGVRLVLDLSDLTYLGSHGLAVLADLDGAARDRSAALVVVTGAENKAVLRPVALTAMDQVLRLAPTLDAALEGPAA